MKKLKIILLFKIIFILAVLLRIFVFNQVILKYNLNDTQIIGIVNKINIDGNKLSLEIKAKENLLAVYYFKENENINYSLGDTLQLKCVLNMPKENTNFNLFNYKNYLLSKKINYLCNIQEIKLINKNNSLFYKIKNNIINHINKYNSKTYLKAFVLGDNSLIESNISDSYQNNGISHLFAISGMHITLISTVLVLILNKFFKNKKRNIFIVILFLLFYSFLTNFSPSVLRATLLFIIINIKKIFNLKIKTIEILIFILGVLLIYNPFYIYNIGFIFSFIISIFLIIYGNISNNYNNYFIKLLLTSSISFFASIPILINNFFSINLLTPFINIIFVPFISFVVFPFSLLTLIFPCFDNILLFITNMMEYLSLMINNIKIFNIILSSTDKIIVIFYYILIIIILNNFKKKKYKCLIFLFVTLFVHSNIHSFNKYPIITLIDVGQGDSILIELPYNKGNILIDTGGIISYNETWYTKSKKYSLGKSTIIPYLKSVGIKKLDYLILTHGDNDHVLEANNIINNFNVKKVIFNSGKNNENELNIINNLKGINYLNVNEYSLNIDKYKLSFINDKDQTNENEDSLIIYTTLNNKNILLMGDAGKTSEKYILDTYDISNLDILKVGHHGSKYSTGEDFLKKLNLKYAFISVGLNNKFNHPSDEVIELLKKYNVASYLTSINGMIKIVIKNNIEVYTCLEGTLMH